MSLRTLARVGARLLRRRRDALTELRDVRRARQTSADLAVFHQLAPSPSGGGNQFIRALIAELERRGVRVELNTISPTTNACLVNSFNFDPARLRRALRSDVRVVHRVDGPVGVYRGTHDGTDERIWRLNRELAAATIFQSEYSLRRHLDLGLEFADAHVVHNAPDRSLFHPVDRPAPGSRVRLITTSWSDNPNKGADVLRELEQILDWTRYAFTFVGRTRMPFERIEVVDPVPSAEVARLLQEHDVFVFPSLHESCSNALLEALACGLPVAYADSGSNGELAGGAGVAFSEAVALPAALDRLAAEWVERRARIVVPTVGEVADAYSTILGLDA